MNNNSQRPREISLEQATTEKWDEIEINQKLDDPEALLNCEPEQETSCLQNPNNLNTKTTCPFQPHKSLSATTENMVYKPFIIGTKST